ncbi:hypothetical protein Moror_8070 [Moniliophthora roreri MCA 2997]|uniref:RING-type domain-containing protein n=1 Tax=Moniliophthora roreri (strain MCA 2997) TaxID=1381753 RepID=V2XKZ0_MONRO|nr:hypothetical protein Moror_8070 [Moniliophthora roreri MCA 2997]
MPETRGSAIRKRKIQENKESDPDVEPHAARSDEESDIEGQIRGLMKSAMNLKKKLKYLKEENSRLQKQFDDRGEARATNRGNHGRGISLSSIKKIGRLEKEIKELKEAREKDKRKIAWLKRKEMQREVENLVGPDESVLDEDDTAHNRTRLLRRFVDLVYINTLADDGENCVICLEKLQVKKTSGLPCGHVICNDCLPGISIGADETVKCAECRAVHPRDEVEEVQYTERERWDQLLEAAKAAAAIDSGHRGVEDTSEEEMSEDFINDDEEEDEDNKSSLTANNPQSEGGDSDAEENEAQAGPSTPPLASPRKYTEISSAQKRSRMKQLAEERRSKRTRR